MSVTTRRRDHRVAARHGLWWATLAAVIVIHLARPDGPVGQVTYLWATLGASVAAWIGVVRRPIGARAALSWVALGVTLSGLGDAIYGFYVIVRNTYPNVSFSDPFWIASYVALGAGLFQLLRGERRHGRFDVEAMIDLGAVGTVALLAVWRLSLAGTLADSSQPIFVRLIWGTYPILDAAILALVVRVVVSGRIRSATGALLAAGAGCWLVSDFAYTLLAPSHSVSAWLDAGWMAGAALLASALTLHRPAGHDSPAADVEENAVTRGRVAVGMVPLLLPGALDVGAFVTGGADVNPIPLLVATAALAGLALARTIRLLRVADGARERVHASERYFRMLASNSSDAVFVADADGRIMRDSPNLAALVGYVGESTCGVDATRLVLPDDLDEAQAVFAKALRAPGEVFESEVRVRHASGAELWLATRTVSLLDDPDVRGVVINLQDITRRKRAEADLEHQAFHDALTGLANRALYRDRVEHALERNATTVFQPAVIYLDIDGFKMVNDSLGHDIGDDLLCEVARRLVGAVRAGDTVARLGGDEFAIVIERSNRPADEAAAVADRVLLALTEPIAAGDMQITISASVGIAIGEEDSTAASLLRNADIAMYSAKTGGKKQWVLYDPEMRAAAVERLQLEADLATALVDGQLRLAYQPIVNLESEEVVGFEALLRWDHPMLGTVRPDKFIPIAEENGSIVQIGRWVLETACRTAARWQRYAAGETNLTMAVNVSARQLSSNNLVLDVADALAHSGLEPGSLVLEMTETVLVQDASVAAKRLHELRELGVRLAIDDFGTGYSSLSYLRQFPVDILKIDRSFINTIVDGNQVPAIVRGLLDLGRTLELETVAEGIEDDAQRDQLRGEHCDFGQGYLFARPLMLEDAEQLVTRLISARRRPAALAHGARVEPDKSYIAA
jgi:diguanylate cyclase (GGDEF)-like protein/PAS domain S-box-containing protein